MKQRSYARISLGVAIVGLLISLPFRSYFWGNLCFTGFEAGLVGGLADWFAVTALFRHPLGQAWVPHTAIIPKNKNQIIHSIEDLVQNDWFRLEFLSEKIRGLSISNYLLKLWQDDSETRGLIQSRLSKLLELLVQKLPLPALAEKIEGLIHSYGKNLSLSPLIGKVIKGSMQNGYDQKILDFLLQEAEILLKEPGFREFLLPLLKKVSEGFATSSNPLTKLSVWAIDRFDFLNYEELSVTLQERILQEVRLIRTQPEHEVRIKLLELFPQLLNVVEENPDVQASIEEWKLQMIPKLKIQEPLLQTLESLKGVLGFFLQSFVMQLIHQEVQKLQEDAQRRLLLDEWAQQKAIPLLQKNHHLIGKFVKENLEKLNDAEFVNTLESKVGNDLQWIRVNGAVVGTLVGILLYLATKGLEMIPWMHF